MAAKKIVDEIMNTDERVTVFLPPARDNEDNFEIVSVNGVAMKIQRGVAVKVPKAYKEVLDNAQIANKVLAATIAKASKGAANTEE